MNGRWTIWLDAHSKAVRGVRGSYLFGPHDQKLETVPVVPCDDVAIERAAAEMATWAGPVPHGVDGFRPFAERVLRAAGETP